MEQYKSYFALVESFKNNLNPALSDFEGNLSLTYEDLYKKIYSFVERFSEVKLGDRIILYNIQNIDWVCLYFALILKGAIVVPIDSRAKSDFLKDTLSLLEPTFCISQERNVENVESFLVEEILARPIAKRVIREDVEVSEIIFTSGTWGVPKGVMLSQKNILTNAYQVLGIYHHKKEHTSLSILPLAHAYQQTVGLIVPLIVGSHIAFLNQPDSFTIAEAVKKYKVRTILVVPKLLEVIRASICRKVQNKYVKRLFSIAIRLSLYSPFFVRRALFYSIRKHLGVTLENFVAGGALLKKETDVFFQAIGYRVHIGYGLSETAPVIAMSLSQKRIEGNVGKIVDGLEVKINTENELIVSGDSVFLGYYPHYKNEEFNTGDRVRFGNKGNLILDGRTKNLIIWPTGDKIFAEDLEQLIFDITQVEEVCIVHYETQDGPVVFCALKSDYFDNYDIALIHEKLPRHVRLSRVKVFDKKTFPYTHTLKPNRKAILDFFTKQ